METIERRTFSNLAGAGRSAFGAHALTALATLLTAALMGTPLDAPRQVPFAPGEDCADAPRRDLRPTSGPASSPNSSPRSGASRLWSRTDRAAAG